MPTRFQIITGSGDAQDFAPIFVRCFADAGPELAMNDGLRIAERPDLAAEADFRIGGLLVRPSACRVIDAHGEVRIEPRVMEVLIVLCRANGATVTREQLIDACWSGRAISDDAITRVIAKVRQLANDGDSAPHFLLETLPKVGYRLTDASSRTEAVPPSAQAAPPARSSFAAKWLLLSIAVVVLALIFAAMVIPWRQPQESPHANAQAVRLTDAARALIHERNRLSIFEAGRLLRQAIAADPNYAPAWARLGHATWFAWWYAEQTEPGAKLKLKAEALAYINRALTISPNSAEALAIMGLVQSDTNEGLPWFQRAVRQDPGNADAWLWFGAAKREQGDLAGALAAFEKARELDPAWSYSARSYVDIVFRLRGAAEAYRELDRVAVNTNDQNWSLQERADLEYAEGRLAESAALAAAALRAHPQNPFWARDRLLAIASLLSNESLLDRLLAQDPFMRPKFNALQKPGSAYARAQKSPDTWWDATLVGAQASQLVSEGRSAVLISLYDRRFKSPAEFVLRCPTFCDSTAAGPALIVALRQAGRPADADRILAALTQAVRRFERAGDHKYSTEVGEARIAALAGNAAEAIHHLRDAVQRGWKGQDTDIPDPESDPAYADLRSDPAFKSVVAMLRKSQQEEAERLTHADLSGIP